MILREKKSDKSVAGAYLVALYVFLGLIAGGMAVSVGLFLSGMGEGILIMFPIALLGAIVLMLHSMMTRKKGPLVGGIAVLAVIVLALVMILLV